MTYSEHQTGKSLVTILAREGLQGHTRGKAAAKLDRAKLLAANELAAYSGYASTRKVKTPLKTSSVLQHDRLATVVYIYAEQYTSHVHQIQLNRWMRTSNRIGQR